MKTYNELMEVMSMKDMKQITGGTEAQRKIAQDRQKKREAKDRGFDPKKPVLADKKKEEDEAPEGLDDLLKDIRSEPKAEPKAEKKPEAEKGGALVKRKPDLRKSQIGKWSQGIKNSPGKLAKRPEQKPAPQGVEEVKVKVDEPRRRDDMEGQAGGRPGTTRGEGLVDNMKKKKKKRDLLKRGLGAAGAAVGAAGAVAKGAGNVAKGALRNAKRAGRFAKKHSLRSVGSSTSGNLEGLTGDQRFK